MSRKTIARLKKMNQNIVDLIGSEEQFMVLITIYKDLFVNF